MTRCDICIKTICLRVFIARTENNTVIDTQYRYAFFIAESRFGATLCRMTIADYYISTM